jgi:hypothetical protein
MKIFERLAFARHVHFENVLYVKPIEKRGGKRDLDVVGQALSRCKNGRFDVGIVKMDP